MKYNINITGKDCDGKSYDISGTAEITESAAFKYGNGKCLIAKLENYAANIFDIRYDASYSENNEVAWLDDFIRNYYSDVSNVAIKPII